MRGHKFDIVINVTFLDIYVIDIVIIVRIFEHKTCLNILTIIKDCRKNEKFNRGA